MNKKMPYTPFSTGLSRSAKETELRIRNIMSGPKKRPPALFLVLMFSVCIFCGNLVSCQVAADTPPAGSDRSAASSVPEEDQTIPVDPEYPPQNEEEEWLLQALFQAAERESPFQLPTARLLAAVSGDGCVLGAAVVEDYWENTLLLGVMDRVSKELTGPIYRYAMKNAVPNVVPFQNYDGESCLLYTFNGQMMGQYSGEAGVVRLDRTGVTWTWPVEGDIRDPDSSAYSEYKDYWTGHLAVAAPGGVDLYTVNPEFEWGKEEPWSMWQLECDELFYADPSSSAELPMPIYFQSLNWLVGHTGDPGGWRITSLTLNEERCNPLWLMDCFTLQACTDGGETLTAHLFFSYEEEGSRRSYDVLDHAELFDSESSAQP